MTEDVDVVVVGARCAGSSTAITLARAGRRVVALDKAQFPSDTVSTHLLWPAGLAELQRLGALPAVSALGAPPLPIAYAAGAGFEVRTGFSPVEGIAHAMCVRRTGLDAALVDTARRVGVDVREHATVTELLRVADRVAGVRYVDRSGESHEVRASVVVGADGRRSTIARLVGTQHPRRSSASGRACYYGYWRDQNLSWRDTAAQWREGQELGTAFPCDDGLVLVLLQPPIDRVSEFRGDVEGAYLRSIEAIPGLAKRLVGSELIGGVRSASDITSYFRRSHGPGWALVGDAGHFKDPVTAQGIRDALRYGRLLGETIHATLGSSEVGSALRRWERTRDRECYEVYQWTNRLARGDAMSQLEVELYRAASRDPSLARQMTDVFSRIRRPAELITPRRALGLAQQAMRNADHRVDVLRTITREVGIAVSDSVARSTSCR
ncbi:MAG TPA: NAD(P)/FAD-dependent oxidoreductase [Mycobacteriales bacterium]|nr:NAD(P)/FAD-dependent oxidoreductase [Mycobacteriales bacterium]